MATNSTPSAPASVPIRLQANPVVSGIGKAPKVGKDGGSTRWPYYKPNDFKNSQRTASGKAGESFTYGSGPGPLSSVSFAPNPMVKDTIGFMTNGWTPYSKLARSFQRKFQDTTQLMHLILIKSDGKPVTFVRRGNKEIIRRYTQLTVPMWNYLQQMKEKMPSSLDEVKTPEEVWKAWSVEGIVKSQEGYEEPHNRQEEGKEYLLNNIVRGFTFTFNIWGPNVKPGTRLWLILKKMNVPNKGKYIVNTIQGSLECVEGIGSRVTDKPYQLFPWADPESDGPTDDDLCFLDEFGFKRRGLAIYIGKAQSLPTAAPTRAFDDIPFNIMTIISQPQIYVFVDPDYDK